MYGTETGTLHSEWIIFVVAFLYYKWFCNKMCYLFYRLFFFFFSFQLILGVSLKTSNIQSSSPMNLLPSACSVISLADSQERAEFTAMMKVREEPMDVETVETIKEEVGSCRGSIPWVHAVGPYLGSMPWVHTMGPYRGSMPWVHTVGPCRGSMPWVHTVGPCRGSMPWVHTVGPCAALIYHFYRPILIQMELKNFTYCCCVLNGLLHHI